MKLLKLKPSWDQAMKLMSALIWLLSLFFAGTASAEADEAPDFFREIRPVLAKACFQCHGPDEETREADLRLDQPSGLFATIDGRTIVAQGNVDGSELVRRILSHDTAEQMPPADSGKSLTDAQKELLVRWIESGAHWEPHWSLLPPQRPPVPDLGLSPHRDWLRNEIDAFILQRLTEAELTPAPSAEPETLIRRVFLDLIGLPPTVAEADEWAVRLRPQQTTDAAGLMGSAINESAWKELVDELLMRPEYGERWGRLWLDVARYADTNGYEKDRPRSIWPYRDWVIQALNDDLPFDRFTVEQLAGDLLPRATQSQRIATGFHRNTMLNEEGGIDPLEFRFHAMTDRVATTGTTWLGLTLGCAQCHSHKYDPLSQREYYQLMAFLNNADEPYLSLSSEELETQYAEQLREADRLLAELPSQWPVESRELVPARIWSVLGESGEQLRSTAGNTVLVEGVIPQRTTYVVDIGAPQLDQFDSLRLEAFTTGQASGPGRAQNGNFVLSELQLHVVSQQTLPDGATKEEQEFAVLIDSVTASAEQAKFSAALSIDGKPETGWAVDTGQGIPRSATATYLWNMAAMKNALQRAAEKRATAVLRIRLIQNHGAGHFLSAFRLSFGRPIDPADTEQQRQEIVDARFAEWLSEQRATAVAWTTLTPVSATSNMPHLTILEDGSILAGGDTTKQDHYHIQLAAFDHPVTALRLEALPDERLPGNGPGTTFYEGRLGDFYLNELTAFAGERPVALHSATESYAKNQFGNTPVSAALTLDGDVQTGWSVASGEGQRHTAVYLLQEPLPAGVSLRMDMIFGRHFASSLGRFRFSATDSGRHPIAKRLTDEEERLLALPEDQLRDDQRRTLFHAFLREAPEVSAAGERIRQLRTPPTAPTTLVMQERPAENPRTTFRHNRGEYLQPTEAVDAHAPEMLHAWPEDLPHNRLGFAQWLVHRSNPLTARVVVNRQWAAFFGRGIVTTVDDFGIQGSAPSHPELLDWLAVTFMDDDHWSLKSLHRRIVLSATWRQQSHFRSESAAVDPENQLLSFSPRYRLDAEIIRDSILKAAGVLSAKRGGPPVRPLQPPGITEVAFGSPKWDVSSGEDRYRRSIYTFIKRTAPFAMVSTFDGPSGEACIAKRNRSNTPLQALTLLNDPMLVDLAQVSGRSLWAVSADSDQVRIRHLFRQCFARLPDEEELRMLGEFVTGNRKRFLEHRDEAASLAGAAANSLRAEEVAELAVWTALSRAVFSLDEMVMRP